MKVQPITTTLEAEHFELDDNPGDFALRIRALGGEAYPTDTLTWDYTAGSYVLPSGRRIVGPTGPVLGPTRAQFWGQRQLRGNDQRGMAGQHANAVVIASEPGEPTSSFTLAYRSDWIVFGGGRWAVFTEAAFAEHYEALRADPDPSYDDPDYPEG